MSKANRLLAPTARRPKAVVIYDESSSPGADDYIIDSDYPIEICPLKNPAEPIAVSYAQIGLHFQSQRKRSNGDTKPAAGSQVLIVCVNGRFNMPGWVAAETGTQLAIFHLSALKKQLPIF